MYAARICEVHSAASPLLLCCCRAVAEAHQRSRQDVARIHLALEAAARENLGAAHDRIRRELHSQLDARTHTMVRAQDT